MPAKLDYIKFIGKRYDYLEILTNTGNQNNDHRYLAKCYCHRCGRETYKIFKEILNGHTKSCGCYIKDKNSKSRTTHGMSGTKFYWVWRHILTRCNETGSKDFKDYGGRGIKVQWISFEEFKNDMYGSYLKHCEEFGINNTSIDRIDVNSYYSKENCRWATMKIQQNNKRNNRLITHNDKTNTMSEWADITGINKHTINTRINRDKWSIERALTTPVLNYKRT